MDKDGVQTAFKIALKDANILKKGNGSHVAGTVMPLKPESTYN